MPYDWGDGKGRVHSISLAQHQINMATSAAGGLGAAASGGAGPAKGTVRPTEQAPGAATAPPQASPSGAPTSGATITPDAQYLAEAAQRAFERTTSLNELNAQTKDDQTNTQTAIARLLENVGKDKQQINESANKAGLLYSSTRQNASNDYEKSVTRAQGDLNTSHDQREAGRIRARTAIEQGAPISDALGLAQNAARQTVTDAAAADVGALTAPMSAAPAPTQVAAINQLTGSGAQPAAAKGYTTQQGQGGVWHIYPGGRRVWVPARR